MTRDRADRELRRRFGQSETARQRQAQEATARREAELAAGHGEVRLAGFVTVSGRDDEELRRACAEVLEHAARARLELHRMYGQQADAFTLHAAAVPGAASDRARLAERPGHRCTTRHAQAIYPFVAAGGLGGRGVFIGRDSSGGAFCYDPWVLYADGDARRSERDRARQARAGQERAGQDAAVADAAVRAPGVRARRQARVRAAVRGRRRATGLARPGRRRAAEPTRLPPRGARPARTAARGRRRPRSAARSPRSRRPHCGRRCATVRACSGVPSRRCPTSPRCCSTRTAEMADRSCGPPRPGSPPTPAARRSPSRTCARGRCEGIFDGPDQPGSRPRRAAARARPARGAGLAGGRDPDGVRDGVDERTARADGRAARP